MEPRATGFSANIAAPSAAYPVLFGVLAGANLLLVAALVFALRRQPAAPRAGPDSVLGWPTVSRAPPPAMDASSLLPGGVLSHADARGRILKLRVSSPGEEPRSPEGGGTTVNLYFTRRGGRRSGDLHAVPQYDVLLTGRASLRMLDPATGREETRAVGPNELVRIPPYWPHVFEFSEDASMVEWWGGPFEAWYYSPYRDEVEEAARRLEREARERERGEALLDGKAMIGGDPPPPHRRGSAEAVPRRRW
ncbi:hypothetical protein DFJ74DRAFT_705210 [Hyaloraphidium curvatum]|nr:hypothetical protein DFJ74DRAFT_705210 [Hyaloraphidium curvatum]